MYHGSYDFKLGSKRLILVGDIRSRSRPHIGDSYGTQLFTQLFTIYLGLHQEQTKMHILWDFSLACVPLCKHCACFALLDQCLQARKHHNNRWLVGLWLANVKGIMLPILKNVSFFFRDSHFVSYYIQHACTLHTQHAHSSTEVKNNWVKTILNLEWIFILFKFSIFDRVPRFLTKIWYAELFPSLLEIRN